MKPKRLRPRRFPIRFEGASPDVYSDIGALFYCLDVEGSFKQLTTSAKMRAPRYKSSIVSSFYQTAPG